jgi:ectoine hydroxylase-related dioxygenase (phytanoyl-CoA dioxygenase family)
VREARRARAEYLAALHELGFCVISGVVPAANVARTGAAYDRVFAAATEPDRKTSSTGGDTRVREVLSRASEFDALFTLEPVLAACADAIGPGFKLSSCGARTVLPGAAPQRLHVDVRPDEDAWPLIGFIVMVDEFRADNGATRFVPGSHLSETRESAAEGNYRPDDGAHVLACGPPGSVVVYFGSTWHGYSANRATAPRRSIQGAYIPRSGTAAVHWASHLTLETIARLSSAARSLLSIE